MPHCLCHKIPLSEHLITEQFEVGLLVVVDRDKDNPTVGEEVFGDAEAFAHKGEPFAVAVAVLAVDKAVVVNEVLVARVVGRVDIDDVNLTFVGIREGGEGFEVVALNQDMIRGIFTPIGECKCFVFH